MINLNEAQELIAKRLSEEISKEELSALNEWIQVHPENERIWIQSKKVWESAAQQPRNINVDAAWQKVDQQTRGKVIKLNFTRTVGIAASFLILALVATWLVFKPGSLAHVQTAANELKKVTLPDGTEVLLHEFSSLSYTNNLKGDEREVTLTGLAFFDVKRDEAHPFVIHTPKGEVRVLGTSFEVDAYEKSLTERVTVKTGKVKFSSNKGSEVVLLPNQEGTLNSNGELTSTIIDEADAVWFSEKKLVFSDTRMDKAARKIERYFHIEVKFATPKIQNCHFTGTFQDPKLNEVLDALSQSLQLKYEHKGNRVVFSGVGCEEKSSN